jgi:lipid-A-disaccharide synthase
VPQILIVAGEASGDLHGANLITAMKRLNPTLDFLGIGGSRMADTGMNILIPSSDMAVVGLTEVFYKLQSISRAYFTLRRLLKDRPPALLVLIDYPDFNIRLARIAKRHGVPVLYYISPQVWAWRRGRVNKIARRVDRMAVILPFEKAFYLEAGLRVDYVGHPLLDTYPGSSEKIEHSSANKAHRGNPVIALLPGSRSDEIRNMLPAMVSASEVLSGRYPELRCVLPLAPTISRDLVQPFIDRSKISITLFENIYEALSVCDLALVTSGTATLQAAIMEVPMIIAYRLSPITYWVGRRVVRVPHIGLVNLVAEEEVVPELIQTEVTPERLAREAVSILEDGQRKSDMIKKLKMVKNRMGEGGASERTARVALEMIGAPPGVEIL